MKLTKFCVKRREEEGRLRRWNRGSEIGQSTLFASREKSQ
jgi:hypothetical protein